MLEYVIYLVIFLNGVVFILWKDVFKVDQVVEVMKIIVKDLLEMEVIEEIVFELCGGVYWDYEGVVVVISEVLVCYLEEMKGWSGDQLKQDWYEKFCKIGFVMFEFLMLLVLVEVLEEFV